MPRISQAEMSEREEALSDVLSELDPGISGEAASRIVRLLTPLMRDDKPTAAQRVRFGLRQMFRGVSEAYENAVGFEDPPDDAFVRPGRSHAAKKRAKTPPKSTPPSGQRRGVADDVSDPSGIISSLMQEVEAQRAETGRFRGIAEKNAQEALRARGLRKQVEQLQASQVQSGEKISQLVQALEETQARAGEAERRAEEADARAQEAERKAEEESISMTLKNTNLRGQLVRIQEQLQALKTENEKLEEASGEFQSAVEALARLVEMEQTLRTEAESQTEDLQQTLESNEAALRAGIAELIGKVEGILRKAREGVTNQGANARAQENAGAASRVTELEHQLYSTRTSERQARSQAEAARQSEAQARAEVAEATRKAEEAIQRAREANARAQKNAGAVLEAARYKKQAQGLEGQVRELERALSARQATHEKIRRIMREHGVAEGERAPGSQTNVLPPGVSKAYITLQLEPPSSLGELSKCVGGWAKLIHPDHQESSDIQDEATARMREINLAAKVVREYLEGMNQRRSA